MVHATACSTQMYNIHSYTVYRNDCKDLKPLPALSDEDKKLIDLAKTDPIKLVSESNLEFYKTGSKTYSPITSLQAYSCGGIYITRLIAVSKSRIMI